VLLAMGNIYFTIFIEGGAGYLMICQAKVMVSEPKIIKSSGNA